MSPYHKNYFYFIIVTAISSCVSPKVNEESRKNRFLLVDLEDDTNSSSSIRIRPNGNKRTDSHSTRKQKDNPSFGYRRGPVDVNAAAASTGAQTSAPFVYGTSVKAPTPFQTFGGVQMLAFTPATLGVPEFATPQGHPHLMSASFAPLQRQTIATAAAYPPTQETTLATTTLSAYQKYLISYRRNHV